MEFGMIPQLNEFQASSVRKLEIVDKTNPTKIVEAEKEPKEILEVKSKELEDNKEVKSKKGDFSDYNEVSLTNLSFGYNSESKDFFIKVKRGDFEAQYPTDEMMRLKAHLLQAQENASEEAS